MSTAAAAPLLHHQDVAQVLDNRALSDRLWLMALAAPAVARLARPGHFIHLATGPGFTLRRPFSILDADPLAGTLLILYQVVGEGTAAMTTWQPWQRADLIGPIGRPFAAPPPGHRALLVGGGVGLAPVEFQARRLAGEGVETLLLFGSEADSPLPTESATLPAAGLTEAGMVAMAHLQEAGVPSRLASLRRRPGWFTGYVTDLAAVHLAALPSAELARTTLYACGPHPMLQAVAALARRYGLSGEVSLEARMACGFGACAGCVAAVGGRYQRVCVDGPVFPIDQVDWQHG